MNDGIINGADGRPRCWWCGDDPLYVAYHDDEWGVEQRDDHRLYEKLCLEGFQAGLSWITILRKRENFRKAFARFDPARVVRFGEKDVKRLLADAGIVRHRGKIESTINNAARVIEIQAEETSFADWIWSFRPEDDERPKHVTKTALMDMAQTATSKAMSKALKKRGFSFVGPTTCYAFMQSTGMVNDHVVGCDWRSWCVSEVR